MFAATLFVSALFASALADFTIQTPASIKQCTAVQLSWSPSKGPYNIVAVAAADPCGDILADLGDVNGTTLTWTPKLAPGQNIMLSIEDVNGEEAWTGNFSVLAGSTSCLTAKSSSTSAAGPESTESTGSTGGSAAPVGAVGSAPLTGTDNSASVQRLSIPILALSAIFAAATLL
ncbi:hypothetical protein C8J56DRAFT_930692 [Mycena floridula]|nr:hypothetical protein C8J56DRAFT_930692 [Mycena floridula]